MATHDTDAHADSPPPEPAPGGPAESGSAPPPATAISEPELSQLKAQAAQAAENWDKFLRAAADLENYRKRAAREKEETVRYQGEQMVTALLPVLDNMDRALSSAQEHGSEHSGLVEGLEQIHAQFERVLKDFGLEAVAAAAGDTFDPRLHEAISHEPSAEQPEGAILQQLQRGYKLGNRLLRPARVRVSKGPPADPPPTESRENPRRRS